MSVLETQLSATRTGDRRRELDAKRGRLPKRAAEPREKNATNSPKGFASEHLTD